MIKKIANDVAEDQILSLFEGLQDNLTEVEEEIRPVITTPAGGRVAFEHMTRLELAEANKCDLSSIGLWVKDGKLVFYGIGNKVYYKKNGEICYLNLLDRE